MREKSPRRNFGARSGQINIELMGAGGLLHAPTGLEKLRFTFACSILSCLGLHSRWCSVYKTWPVGGIGQIEWHIIVVLLIHGIVDPLMHGVSVKALERAFALEPHSICLAAVESYGAAFVARRAEPCRGVPR